jgi:c-di-GMP-binding flagellar brake protein YcgR
MSLTEIETRVLKTCCDLNDKLNLNIVENDTLFVYKSRFLAVDFQEGFIIIDNPSPEIPDDRPLSEGQYFEIFFEYKIFRYLFNSKVLEQTKYKLHQRAFYALKILLPQQLMDGDKRDYFRVETGMKPPITVKFNIFAKGLETTGMSTSVENTPQEFKGEMVDISGGGFAMKVKVGDKPFPLEKGDIINARFKLKPGDEMWEIWSEVRNKRKYKDTRIVKWGMRFLGKERNRNINYYRNKILRYVTERQREILLK